MANFEICQLEELPPTACPCGQVRRAFQSDSSPASVHVVDISADAKAHYHRATTETYVVLEGEGRIVPEPGTALGAMAALSTLGLLRRRSSVA